MIGNNAGFSMLGGVDRKAWKRILSSPGFVPIFKRYEELRNQDYFSDTVRAILRHPGKEYTLFQEEDGDWNFKPVAYRKHKVEGPGHPRRAGP